MNKITLINGLKNSPLLRPAVAPLYELYKHHREKYVRLHPLSIHNEKSRRYYGHDIDIVNPHTLYDKYMSVIFLTDTSQLTRCSDKAAVRDYMAEIGMQDYLVPAYHIFDERPDFETFTSVLPAGSCVVKTTHSGGGESVCLIHDRDTTDLRHVYRKMMRSLDDDYGARTGTPHYNAIKPRILVEEMLVDTRHPGKSLDDYKFFCINGEPVFINALGNRDLRSHTVTDQFYDLDMHRYDWKPQNIGTCIAPPPHLGEMTELARKLAQPFAFVRVDLYNINGRIYFGELTFTPGPDFFIGTYGEEVLRLGERLDISGLKRVRDFDPSWL